MLAEYRTGPAPLARRLWKEHIYLGSRLIATESTEPAGRKYLVADHLGSARVMMDSAGDVKSRHDYFPFGKEIPPPWSGRSTALGYGVEERSLHRFTGKEVDTETGLEYFGARYYSGRQGRFTTPDPMMASATARNPQTWNRYAYALNNPLRYFDPDGLDVPEECAKDPNCTIVVKVNVIYDTKLKKALTPEQRAKFEEQQIKKAQKDFGTSNIKLDVTYTEGSWKYSESGSTIDVVGARPDALNIIASTIVPGGERGLSYTDKASDIAFAYVNVNEAHASQFWPVWANTTEHELGHHFLGHTYLPTPGTLKHFWQDVFQVENRLAEQSSGKPQRDFRTGLEHRRYAAPLNPEANKPRQ